MQSYFCHRKPCVAGLKNGFIGMKNGARTTLLQINFRGKKWGCDGPIFYSGNRLQGQLISMNDYNVVIFAGPKRGEGNINAFSGIYVLLATILIRQVKMPCVYTSINGKTVQSG
jgi:hypothetical protein